MMRIIIMFLFLCIYLPGFACTTILIGKQCTMDGSVIMGHNEDMGYEAVGKLWYTEAKKYTIPKQIDIPYISYELDKTYGYWASGNAKAGDGLGKPQIDADYKNVLVGINEYGLTMACNWMHSKEEATKENGINRYALRQLILETNASAREAVVFIGQMIEEYGQADWGGLTYCLADAEEAWIVETTATQWVARKISETEILAVANQFTIAEDFDLHSKNLYKFAIAQGWYNEKEKFSFRKVYGNSRFMDTHYDKRRSDRVAELLAHKKGIITVNDVKEVLRDRYEDTADFSLPTVEECWREWCIENDIRRPISTNITQSSFIAHLTDNAERILPPVLWYASATPNFSGYFPIFASSTSVPAAYSKEGLKAENAWQYSKKLQVEGDKNYHKNSVLAQSFWKAFENEIHLKMKLLETESIPANRKELLDRFTYSTALDLLRKQVSLLNAFNEE